ncbi:MAG: hypothetical protein HWN67_04210 [Candidatus Helarchaeota archaeon]|nr:hypothetical protein [Candidatus Helarchaeota archaeon]
MSKKEIKLGMICINCEKNKKFIHLCEFKGMNVICDECCKLIQSKDQCTARGCAHREILK